MALWRDGISITVEIAFSTAPLATTPTWTDVTDYVREVPHVQRGRTDEYGDFAPGSATVVLDNRDRRFDPDYSSSPYDPDVVPMRRIKITWAIGASSGLIFTGFVLGWPQQERGESDGFCTISCVDGSRFVENAPLTESAYQWAIEQDAPVMYWPLQDDSPFENVGSESTDLLPQQDAHFSDPQTSEQDRPVGSNTYAAGGATATGLATSTSTFSAPKIVEFWKYGAGAVAVTVQSASLDYLIVRTDLTGTFVEYSNDTDNRRLTTLGGVQVGGVLSKTKPTHVAFRADSTNMYLIVDGVLLSTTALTVGSTALSSFDVPRVFVNLIDSTAEVAHVAIYDDDTAVSNADLQARFELGTHAYGYPINEYGGARLERVLDEIGWPSGLRDIDTGATPQGPYEPNGQRLMEYARQVERSEQGLLFFDVSGNLNFLDRQTLWLAASAMTFTDDGNTGDAIFTDQVRGSHVDTIRNIVTTSYSDVGGITRRDSTSITNYGEAAELIQCPTVATGGVASLISAYVLRSRKDPTTRIEQLEVPVRIPGGDNEAADLFGLDIGSKVTVERTPVATGSQVVKTLLVQGIRHTISVNQWTVTLYLSPAPTSNTEAPYLTLGDATYGQIGATAGNLVPF